MQRAPLPSPRGHRRAPEDRFVGRPLVTEPFDVRLAEGPLPRETLAHDQPRPPVPVPLGDGDLGQVHRHPSGLVDAHHAAYRTHGRPFGIYEPRPQKCTPTRRSARAFCALIHISKVREIGRYGQARSWSGPLLVQARARVIRRATRPHPGKGLEAPAPSRLGRRSVSRDYNDSIRSTSAIRHVAPATPPSIDPVLSAAV